MITQDESKSVLEDCSVRIEDSTVQEVGAGLTPHQGEKTSDMSGKLIMPGLVNAHTHAPMNVFRGLSDDKSLERWLEEDVFPAESVASEAELERGAVQALREMSRTGTTVFNDMYVPSRILEALSKTKLTGFLGLGLMDEDSSVEEEIEAAEESIDEILESGASPTVAPHSTYTCSRELVESSWKLSERKGLPFHVHVSETVAENDRVEGSRGSRPVELLEETGALGSRAVLAHCVHLEQKEVEMIAGSGATVAHCPSANLKLGSGIADVPRMLDSGVNIALGTDGVASNNNLNMFEEMKFAALLHKRNGPSEIDAQQVLDMATVNGARALGIEAGKIQEGCRADLAVLDLDNPEMKPLEASRAVSHIVYSFSGRPEQLYSAGERVY